MINTYKIVGKKMKKFALFFLVFFCTLQVKAIEPIVQIPPLPADLDAYTDDENIFFSKLLDYYLPAKILETQIILYNQKPNQSVPQLTYEMISDLETKSISNYYKIAKNLYEQAKSLQYSQIDNELANSKAEIEKLKQELMRLTLDTTGLSQIEETNLFLKENNQNLRNQMNNIERTYLEKIAEIDNQVYQAKLQYAKKDRIYPSFLLTASPIVEQFFFGNDQVKTPISPGAMVNLSVLKLWDNTSIISLWGQYQYLSPQANYSFYYDYNQITFNYNLWSFGLDFELNLSKLFEIDDFDWALKLGGGYLIQNSSNFNEGTLNADVIKLQLDFFNFSKTLPLGIVVGATFNKYLDPLTIGSVYLGTPWVPAIFAGLKFDIVRVY